MHDRKLIPDAIVTTQEKNHELVEKTSLFFVQQKTKEEQKETAIVIKGVRNYDPGREVGLISRAPKV